MADDRMERKMDELVYAEELKSSRVRLFVFFNDA